MFFFLFIFFLFLAADRRCCPGAAPRPAALHPDRLPVHPARSRRGALLIWLFDCMAAVRISLLNLSPHARNCGGEGGVGRGGRVDAEIREARVFDLTVSPTPSFFAAGVLLHNKTVAEPPTMAQAAGTWAGYTDSGWFLRLDLAADGGGTMSFATGAASRVSWSLDRFTLVAKTDEPPAMVRGTIRGDVMVAEFESGLERSTLNGQVRLIRPERFEEQLRKSGGER